MGNNCIAEKIVFGLRNTLQRRCYGTMAAALPVFLPALGQDSDSEEDMSARSVDADLFHEDFDEADEDEVEADNETMQLSISRGLAKRNYRRAGQEMPPGEESIKLANFSAVMDVTVERQLDQLLEELALPFSLAPFQRVAVVTLAMGRNLIMIIPTGQGKMLVALLAALLVRRTVGAARGVTLITQPLTGLMMEQIGNAVCPVAVLSMGGEVTVGPATATQGKGDANLSCSIDDLLAGEYPVLLGHPESFGTANGQRILQDLRRKDLVNLVSIDEFHTGLHWEPFRPDILKKSCRLRAFARPGAGTLIMSATSTKREVTAVRKALNLRSPPLLLAVNPVQPHIKFSVIRRPANAFGFRGKGEGDELKPGLWQLLCRLYFDEMFEDRRAGRTPKRVVIFCRGMRMMVELHTRLRALTGECNARDASFVMVHSNLPPATEKVIVENMDRYTVFLSTTRMMLGLDMKRVDMVILLQPFNELAALLQGGGRGGRRQANGLWRAVQVYMLYNGQDLTRRNLNMSEAVRQVCRAAGSTCTRQLLIKHFSLDNESGGGGEAVSQQWCCDFHDREAAQL